VTFPRLFVYEELRAGGFCGLIELHKLVSTKSSRIPPQT